MKATIVERLHQQFVEIVDQIDPAEITLKLTAEENFRKSLLLAAASYFETRITETISEIVREATDENPLVLEFVRNKAIARQYHTCFQWDSGNANSFFGLFGTDFKSFMKNKSKENEDVAHSVNAFLGVGSARNRLVHQNFGTFALEKDAEEIYQLYSSARPFVENLGEFMTEFLRAESEAISQD